MEALTKHILAQHTPTYAAYYNGKMSYALHGKEWKEYVTQNFPDITSQVTSENVFKDVIDLYAENLMPSLPELVGMKAILVPMLCRGEALAVRAPDGSVSWPENYEIISDGSFTVAAIFTRSLAKMEDYMTIIDSDGHTKLYSKPVPPDLGVADRDGYSFVEDQNGFTLYRLSLADKGLGASLASLQDRVNHSIIDQTVIAEMYARPFWYLMNYQAPPSNPYLPNQVAPKMMEEQSAGGSSGRIFATSSEGPFGQLDPPTIADMIGYHDSLIAKVSQSTGIPEYYFKPGSGTPPSGVALKVLSRRFNGRISGIRNSIKDELLRLATDMGLRGEDGEELGIWTESDDLLQEAMDSHGLALVQMGYPLDYVAEVVTPGVDLDEYLDDGFNETRM